MKNGITHSLKNPELYEILAYGKPVGTAKRLEKGFYFESEVADAGEFGTMSSLKAYVDGIVDKLEGFVQRATAKPNYLTVDEARRITGISHSKTNYFVKFIHEAYPWVRGHQYGWAIATLVMKEKATWDWAHYERQWLVDHAKDLVHLPDLDWEIYNATKKVVYMSKPPAYAK